MSENAKKYSYTEIDTYEQCAFKYKLKYIDKNYVKTPAIALEIGTLIHSTEETIANKIKANEPINYDELKSSVVEKLETIRSRYPVEWEAEDKSGRTYNDKLYMYLKEGIYRLENFMRANPDLEIVAAEQKFLFEYKGKLFRGSIDRVLRNKATNKYIIQDIKTYAVPVEKDKLRVPLQFVVYVLAAMDLYKLPVDSFSCQYDLPFCNVDQDAGQANFVDLGQVKLDEIFKAIEDQEFEPKQQFLCYWCEYCKSNPNAPEESKYLCPYYSHWTKQRHDFSRENKWEGLENHEKIMEKYKISVNLDKALKEAFKF